MPFNEKDYKKIIHVDMDAFYASVEQMDEPSLRGKPIAVGGGRERGVVAAASYEARKYGVKSAMPSILAYRKCPHLIFVKPRFERYKEISKQVMAIFRSYTDIVEPLSLDEAYLDVTDNKFGIEKATKVAMEIRAKIKAQVGLTASAGVSFNKFLAKTASDVNKPDGLFIITPDDAEHIIAELPIGSFYGIGKKTAEKMARMKINYGRDLFPFTKLELAHKFGKAGQHYFNIVRAKSSDIVKAERIRKSVGSERTFMDDKSELDDILEIIDIIAKTTAERLQKLDAKGKTITVKLKYNDFEMHTRSKTEEHYFDSLAAIQSLAQTLIKEVPIEKPVRLLGVTISNLDNNIEDFIYRQLELDFPIESL